MTNEDPPLSTNNETSQPDGVLNRKHRVLKERLLGLLDEKGKHLAPEQEDVVDSFLATEVHCRLDDLLDVVRGKREGASMAMVKATMRLLAETGIARSFTADDERVYEHQHLDEHHDHLVCIKCGDIEEFFDSAIEESQTQAAERAGFRPLFHRMTIHGLCRRCLEASPSFRPLSEVLVGDEVIVELLDGGADLVRRLGDLGVTRGRRLRVVGNNGPVSVLSRGSRVVVGRGMAQHIHVSDAPREEGGQP